MIHKPISHTKYPSRTRITHLVHDYPISHTNTPISHTITPISYTITPHLAHDFKVGLDGVFAVMVEKRREEHG